MKLRSPLAPARVYSRLTGRCWIEAHESACIRDFIFFLHVNFDSTGGNNIDFWVKLSKKIIFRKDFDLFSTSILENHDRRKLHSSINSLSWQGSRSMMQFDKICTQISKILMILHITVEILLNHICYFCFIFFVCIWCVDRNEHSLGNRISVRKRWLPAGSVRKHLY